MLAALWLFLWFYQGWPLRVCMMFVMGLGMIEVSQAFAKEKIWPCGVACMAFALIALPAYLLARQALDPFAALSPVLLIAMLCLILGMSLLVLRGTVDGRSLLATAFPILYPGLLFAMLFPLVDLGGRAQVALVLGHALVIALANDLAAYEIGTLFGKRKLSPVISPKKTVEGSLAGFAAGILVACGLPFLMRLIWPQLQLLPVWMYALLGAFASVAAQLGDLSASYIKRVCEIKDFGSILPGHGGIMDRLDAVLFCATVCTAFYHWFGI